MSREAQQVARRTGAEGRQQEMEPSPQRQRGRARLRSGAWGHDDLGGQDGRAAVDVVVLGEAHLDLNAFGDSITKGEGRSLQVAAGRISRLDLQLGGKGAIEAVCLARLGVRTAFVHVRPPPPILPYLSARSLPETAEGWAVTQLPRPLRLAGGGGG